MAPLTHGDNANVQANMASDTVKDIRLLTQDPHSMLCQLCEMVYTVYFPSPKWAESRLPWRQ